MGKIGRTKASLRLAGEELDPDQISRVLGCAATMTYRKGDPVMKDGRGSRGMSFWSLESGLPETATIDEHVAALLRRVSQDRAVWQSLARFKPDIFLGLFVTGFNQGDSVSALTASMLAERGIELQFDIYSHSDEDG